MSATATTPRKPEPFAAVVAAAVALTLVLRAPFLGTPLGIDEGGVAYVAQHWTAAGTSLYGDVWLDRPPLLVWLYRIAVTAGGAAGVRVVGCLAAAALVVVCAHLARELAGPRAGRIAAVIAALLASSIAIQAVWTPAELLAAVPSALSVLALVRALRGGRLHMLLAAGACAALALLVKQSFLDATLAGTVFLVACAIRRPPGWSLRWAAAWLAGLALPLVAVGLDATLDHRGPELLYAVIGFRIDALQTLGGSHATLLHRLAGLAAPVALSGLGFALAGAPAGLRRLPAAPVLAATFAAWLAGGAVGVLGGGTYWPHYLIELVPVTAVLAAVALDAVPARAARAMLGPAVVLAAAAAALSTQYVARAASRAPEPAIGRYVRSVARPGDTAYVLYARANILFYAGLPTPYPYAWSLMVRVRPRAAEELAAVLRSSRRPTWIVRWEPEDAWHLDPSGRLAAILHARYRRVATVAGRAILRRTDVARPR